MFLAAIGLYFGIPLWQAHMAMYPSRIPIGDVTPAALGLDFEDITLITEDGLKLGGWYIPAQNRAAVIMAHGYNGNRTGNIYHAELLANHGYGVLLYDTRSQGESEGDLYSLGWEDHLDILAAVDFLQNRPEIDQNRIGFLGLSAGAKAGLFTVTQTDQIKAYVGEGTRWRTFEDLMLDMRPKWIVWIPADWVSYKYVEIASGIFNPIPLREAVPEMDPIPIYLIAAEGELINSQAYYDLAPGPKTLWIRDEPGHQTDALFDEPQEYEARVIGFFDQYLLENNH